MNALLSQLLKLCMLGAIPGGATLLFDVEIVSIVDNPAGPAPGSAAESKQSAEATTASDDEDYEDDEYDDEVRKDKSGFKIEAMYTPRGCKKAKKVGDSPEGKDFIHVRYRAKLEDGTEFENTIGGEIDGVDPNNILDYRRFWTGKKAVKPRALEKGVMGMCIGEKRRIVIVSARES